MKCSECGGTGYVELVRGGVDNRGPWQEYVTRPCPECDGDGEVPDD